MKRNIRSNVICCDFIYNITKMRYTLDCESKTKINCINAYELLGSLYIKYEFSNYLFICPGLQAGDEGTAITLGFSPTDDQ